MAEFAIARDSDQLHVEIIKLLLPVIELTDFSWADESKVHWPEEKDDVLASELFKTDLLNSFLPPCLRCEEWCWASDDSFCLICLDHALISFFNFD